jgi:hypothetical protein
LNSKPHLAEKIFGWDRKTVAPGLNELRSGVVCIDNFKARGNKKSAEKMPQLEIDRVSLRGTSRCRKAVKADGHDRGLKDKLWRIFFASYLRLRQLYFYGLEV